jgi:short-subunit dehydrogenase
MFQVNTLGVIYAIEAVLPDMLKRGKGHLAAISSLASYLGMPGESAYCASKAAVNFYMDGLRIELRPRGIHVTTVCPGFIETPMTAANDFDMPWLLQADVAAEKIVKALERKKKIFNFPWQLTLLIKCARWMPDWAIARVLEGKAGKRKEDVAAVAPPSG